MDSGDKIDRLLDQAVRSYLRERKQEREQHRKRKARLDALFDQIAAANPRIREKWEELQRGWDNEKDKS